MAGVAIMIGGLAAAAMNMFGQAIAPAPEEKAISAADAEKLETIELASEAAFKRFEAAQTEYQKTIERLNTEYKAALQAAAKALGIDPASKDWVYIGQRKKFVKQPPEQPPAPKK